MRIGDLLALLRECPIVASVQAAPGSPLHDGETLLRLAQASAGEGVRVLRLEGVDSISRIRSALGLAAIGLIKREVPGSDVFITPTCDEVDALLETGCEVVALDATCRARPRGERLADLIGRIHRAGRLAMADCDSPESVAYALQSGADVVGTTLSGYTDDSPIQSGPDLDLVRHAVGKGAPVLAEGRYAQGWHVASARAIGAAGIVVGGALNDPVKQTRAFVRFAERFDGPVAGFDIGGTWLRFGLFASDGSLVRREQVPTPPTAVERLAWIAEKARRESVARIGISTGGTVDPRTRTVIESKPLIPDNVGCDFSALEARPVEAVVALNDGLAAAWGHACHPSFAGKRVATLALGTGVGFGLVDQGRIWMGGQGGYPRLNDVPTRSGETFEELLGGAALTDEPSEEQWERARFAAREAVRVVNDLFYPDEIVLCGGVGLSGRLAIELPRSPYGADAGLYGAAALARFRPF